MADLPYPIYEFYQKITPEQMAIAPLMTFGPMDIGGTKWEAVADVRSSTAYSSGYYKITLTKGYSYDITSSSFFQPSILKVFDNLGNVVAYGSDNLYSTEDDIWSFVAPYTGTYYIDASWNKGVYYTSASLSVYEDRNPVKPNHAPTGFLFEQLSWKEGSSGQYTVPATAFKDSDGDVLTYSATLGGGSALPSWLSFNPVTRTFSGTAPYGSADVAITVTARDPGGLTARGDIIISTSGLAPELVVGLASAAILRGSDTPQVTSLINQVKASSISVNAAIAQLVTFADATTSVATLNYQFFTGKIPGEAGIGYLVSSTGSNPNNLNSTYYKTFNLENRYINFAVNLGKVGEGRAKFEADYGSLTLEQATKKAYGVIFGAQPTDAKVTALLSGGRDLYFESFGGDGHNGVGTKAAMVGWLLAEAEKADIGMYARSNAAFLTDIADGGSWAVDLVGVYGRSQFVYGG